ncbi:MAG: helix-turn-helix transcriptional regulator [Treponema sp.]|nr:helix-turn-helix transcriptional regulator [Treponema sp.]
MGFWNNVELECRYKGITRKELAAAAHFSVNTISTGLKRNGMPAADLALRISKVLGIPLEQLLESRESTVSRENISDIYERQKLLLQYLPYIEKLKQMPRETAEAVLTIIDNIRV